MLGYLQEPCITLGAGISPINGGKRQPRQPLGETKDVLLSLGNLPCSKFVADNTSVCDDLAQSQLQVDLALQGTRTVLQVDKACRKPTAL